MEVTNEIKTKMFAQYLGQKYKTDVPIIDHHTYIGELTPYVIYRAMDRVGWKWTFKLILKPLSSITDEDALWIRALLDDCGYEDEEVRDIINCIDDVNSCDIPGFVWIEIIDGFRSRGYDIKNGLLNGKTLHEAGLAIYE